LRAKQKHGMSKTTEYRIWTAMIQRCHNKKTPSYRSYGKRGIQVCDSWRKSFLAFFADMGPRPAGLSLDRINNDGNYEPANCRWATKHEQARNRRDNVRITLNGATKSPDQWSAELGLSAHTISRRRKEGYSPEEVLARKSFGKRHIRIREGNTIRDIDRFDQEVFSCTLREASTNA